MSDVNLLQYPNRSHRKQVILPDYSVNLAEFFGIMIGDGGINNDWQAKISLNSIADLKYKEYVVALCISLFGFPPAVHYPKSCNVCNISIDSVAIVDLLVEKGLLKGNKLEQGLSIPSWVMEKEEYRKACMRGLMDTDGCLYIHEHTVLGSSYSNIGLCFSSYSPELILQTSGIFDEFGIVPHINKRGTEIYLYKVTAVAKYLEIFGTSNPRISSVYETWKGARVV